MRASTWLVLEPCRTRQHRDEFKIVAARATRPKDKPCVKVTVTLPDDAFQFVAPDIEINVEPNSFTVVWDPEIPITIGDPIGNDTSIVANT